MVTGRFVRFDEGKGYGFIAPDSGGEDVFVHANELADKARISTGTRVTFNVVDSGRGPKAYDVRILEAPAEAPVAAPALGTASASGSGAAHDSGAAHEVLPDDDTCEIFAVGEFRQQITELLLESGPQLTGAQILELRTQLLQFARKNRWVE